jgi:hypothetical protein
MVDHSANLTRLAVLLFCLVVYVALYRALR